jgi:redox-sensing transcriptional repressor
VALAQESPPAVALVTLYTKADCHLCEEALGVLEEVRAELPFELEVRDIRFEEALHRAYFERIPVVSVDGEELFEFFVDAELLRESLEGGAPRTGHRQAAMRPPSRAPRRSPTRVTTMAFKELIDPAELERDGDGNPGERLSLGVAARLSRYLQVLTQAKKMGKETISSQELSDYTHVNSTQIRRDLSGFGKFGKRGVGYNVESLVSQIRKILRTAGQHNIALLGAGHLGKAIASSDIFADHGFRVVAIFDVDEDKVGSSVGSQTVRHTRDLRQVVEDEDIVVGVLAVPGAAAQQLADELVRAGVKIIFNYSESLLAVPPEVTVHTSSPAVDLLYALYFYLT